MKSSHRLPSPALIVGLIALVAAMAGTATALPGKGSVDTDDLKRRAVTSPKIDQHAVRGGKIQPGAVKGGKIRNNAVKGSKVADGSLTGDDLANGSVGAGKLRDHQVLPLTGIPAAATPAAATEQELLSKGAVSLTAKCYDDGPQTRVVVYAKTSAANSLLRSDRDNLFEGPFLEPDTNEDNREVLRIEHPTDNSVTAESSTFQVAAGNGSGTLNGEITAFVKKGTLTGGNGIYGDGNTCAVTGHAAG